MQQEGGKAGRIWITLHERTGKNNPLIRPSCPRVFVVHPPFPERISAARRARDGVGRLLFVVVEVERERVQERGERLLVARVVALLRRAELAPRERAQDRLDVPPPPRRRRDRRRRRLELLAQTDAIAQLARRLARLLALDQERAARLADDLLERLAALT